MDDTDYKKQRSSLILISMAIILYILGEGKIGSNGGIFGGTIVFGKTDILEKAGILIYLWLNFRYILSCKPNLNKFGSHFRYFLYKNKFYKKCVTKGYEKIKEKISDAPYIGQCMDRTILWNKGGDGTIPPLIKNLFWPSTFFFNHQGFIISQHDAEQIMQGNIEAAFPRPNIEGEYTTAPAPFFKILLLELWIIIHVAWAHKPFSDIVAPFFISLYAAYLLLTII